MNPKKVGAVAAILTTRTYRAAAKAAGVGERTLRRWRRVDPEFRGLLRGARKVHRRRALRGAWRAASAAAGTLADLAVSLGRPDRVAALEARSPGALVNDLWATIRTSERVLEIAGLLEVPDEALRREVRRLEARVAALERRGGGER